MSDAATARRPAPAAAGSRARDLLSRARGRLRVPELVRREPVLLVLTVVAGVWFAWFSIWDHVNFGSTGFDLGIADQSVWHYSRFESPRSTLLIPTQSALGDHFSPILALLAPLYWIWADPRMLLGAQAALLAGSAIPVFLYARPRMGRLGAYGLIVAYLLFWGFASGLSFDFHEVCFVPLLLASALLFADRERWTPFYVAAGLLLLVKEDQAVVVAALGVYLLVKRQYRPGLIAIGAGIAWFLLATKVITPAINPDGEYVHWNYTNLGTDGPNAVLNILRYPGLPFHELLQGSQEKARTLAYTFVPFLALIVYSPLLLIAAPLLAARFLSTTPLHWSTGYHYAMTIAPLMAMGAADGLRNLLRLGGREYLMPIAAVVAAAAMIFANVHLAKKYGLWQATDAGFPRMETPGKRTIRRAVAMVPDGASVATHNELVPHLSGRDGIYVFRHRGGGATVDTPRTDYLVLRTDGIWAAPPSADPGDLQRELARRRAEYDTLLAENGLVVLKRRR
jgi:uncharacterized membrane protein